jgi:hypothetical protein
MILQNIKKFLFVSINSVGKRQFQSVLTSSFVRKKSAMSTPFQYPLPKRENITETFFGREVKKILYYKMPI